MDLAIVGDRPGAINFIACSMEDARQLVAKRITENPKADTGAGVLVIEADDICGGDGQAYVAFQGGQPLVVVVLGHADYGQGRELEIRGAVAVSNRQDATELVLPAIEGVFGAGCVAVSLYTKRAGLVKKLAAQGYAEACRLIRKKL